MYRAPIITHCVRYKVCGITHFLGFLKLYSVYILCSTTLIYNTHTHTHLPRFGPFFVEPVLAGLDIKTHQPYIATMDLIGCPMETSDFVVGGTCSEQLYGMCESLWRPDMVRN